MAVFEKAREDLKWLMSDKNESIEIQFANENADKNLSHVYIITFTAWNI